MASCPDLDLITLVKKSKLDLLLVIVKSLQQCQQGSAKDKFISLCSIYDQHRDLPQFGHKHWQTHFGKTFDVYTRVNMIFLEKVYTVYFCVCFMACFLSFTVN